MIFKAMKGMKIDIMDENVKYLLDKKIRNLKLLNPLKIFYMEIEQEKVKSDLNSKAFPTINIILTWKEIKTVQEALDMDNEFFKISSTFAKRLPGTKGIFADGMTATYQLLHFIILQLMMVKDLKGIFENYGD